MAINIFLTKVKLCQVYTCFGYLLIINCKNYLHKVAIILNIKLLK